MPQPIKKEISVDEALDVRKEFSDGEGGLYKAMVRPVSYNDTERSANFVMSVETEDRYRDVVVQAGIDLEHFEKNPVALFGHRSYDMPIGTWSEIKTVRSTPKRTEGKMTFTAEGIDDTADRAARHVKAGTLRACSIGFRPKTLERIFDEEGKWTYGLKFNSVELFECSVVTIPAVREALIKGAGGKIDEILDPVVIEEFLEQIRGNPALSKMIDKQLFEKVYREITGNKTTISTLSVDIDGEALRSSIEAMTKAAERLEAAAKGVKDAVEPDPEPEVDPIHKEALEGLEKALLAVEPKMLELPETETERKSALQGFFDRVRSVFAAPEPEKPVLADDETKAALAARLEAIKARHTA